MLDESQTQDNPWPDSIEECEQLIYKFRLDEEDIKGQLGENREGSGPWRPDGWRKKASFALSAIQMDRKNLERHLGRGKVASRYVGVGKRLKNKDATRGLRKCNSEYAATIKALKSFIIERMGDEIKQDIYSMLDAVQESSRADFEAAEELALSTTSNGEGV